MSQSVKLPCTVIIADWQLIWLQCIVNMWGACYNWLIVMHSVQFCAVAALTVAVVKSSWHTVMPISAIICHYLLVCKISCDLLWTFLLVCILCIDLGIFVLLTTSPECLAQPSRLRNIFLTELQQHFCTWIRTFWSN